MSELLLDYDRLTGMKEFISTDEMTGESFIRYEQDTKDHIDANKEAHNAGFDRKADMWHAASIPNIVLVEWVTKYGIDFFNPNHKEGVKRLLNSSEYMHLKRAPIVI